MCAGPRGNASSEDAIYAYPGVPANFPRVFAGGYGVVGLDGGTCFDARGRYGAYGFGEEDGRGRGGVDWEDVDWGALQGECVLRNRGRYKEGVTRTKSGRESTILPDDEDVAAAFKMDPDVASPENHSGAMGKKFHARTAVLIRAWTGYVFEENDVLAIRAMVAELSLASGGEYEVFLLLHVRDAGVDVFGNTTLCEEVLAANVPWEFRSMTVLWSESVVKGWYPGVGDWQVYWQQVSCLPPD